MKILYYDCFSGISGDMNLGALVDIGVPKEYLLSELDKLKVQGYEISINRGMKMGISGTLVKVNLDSEGCNKDSHEDGDEHHHHQKHNHHEHVHNNDQIHDHDGNHALEHNHEIEQHEHVHNHNHDHHDTRNLKDIEKIISGSELNASVKKLSMEIFMKVAQAEAKVHGKGLYEVHFHEVGAVDSIVDIVGAAICLDYLKVDLVMSAPVELGGGFVKCAHGIIPVPAPATVEILQNIPVKYGVVPFETTTPTGAAILAATVNKFTDKLDFRIKKIGYGVGQRDTDIPNVLRVYIGEIDDANEENSTEDTRLLIECNIDDLNPEIYEYIMDRLFEVGADDVYLTPIIMKKSRPAVILSVLCKAKNEKVVSKVIFEETTTLGVRKHEVEREKLLRKIEDIDTKYGVVRVKKSYYDDQLLNSKLEYDDCKKIAKDNKVPLKRVYDEISLNLSQKDGGIYGGSGKI